jgi:phage terminase large subunit
MRIQLPNRWKPRKYQQPAWDYLENGGKHAELVWHRRSGKDEICLHRSSVAAFERIANYWHMLPEYSQARKAIWDAVNPHTGKKRIDEAFPKELRKATRNQEMTIEFINGSTWQVVGSDNYDSLVGSTPAGITYSEWALANPAARAYLRPILAENNGWQIFITTSRGRNHAYNTLKTAEKDTGAFAQVLPATATGVFTLEQLEKERQDYIDDYGIDMGNALFEQEYLCSFDAAILGAFYGGELKKARESGRIRPIGCDPELPVYAVMDLGFSDDTAIIWFQVSKSEVRVIDAYSTHGMPIAHYHEVLKAKSYKYGEWLYLPHDARAKSLQTGRSIEEQLRALGWKTRIVPQLGLIDGIQAARKTFPDLWIDESCEELLEALAAYRREWDEIKKCFRDQPVHDWTSHYADAFRYACLVWREEMKPKEPVPVKWPQQQTINEIIKRHARLRND